MLWRFIATLLDNVKYADISAKGIAGLTKRDITLVVEGGYNTVESVAYTSVYHFFGSHHRSLQDTDN